LLTLTDALKREGWVEPELCKFEKDRWRIVFDTSNWMGLGMTKTPRTSQSQTPAQHADIRSAEPFNKQSFMELFS